MYYKVVVCKLDGSSSGIESRWRGDVREYIEKALREDDLNGIHIATVHLPWPYANTARITDSFNRQPIGA